MIKKPCVGITNITNRALFFTYKNKKIKINPGEKTKKEFEQNFLSIVNGIKTF